MPIDPQRPLLETLVRERWPDAVPLGETFAGLLAAMPGVRDADTQALIAQAGWARAARQAGATHEELCVDPQVSEDPRAWMAAFLGSRAAPISWESPLSHALRLAQREEPLASLVFILTTASLRRLHPEFDTFPPRRRDRNGRRIGRTPRERWGDRLRSEANFALQLLDGMGDAPIVAYLRPILDPASA